MVHNTVCDDGILQAFSSPQPGLAGAPHVIATPDIRSMAFGDFKTLIRGDVDRVLERLFEGCGDHHVVQVTRYASLGAGHRWRVMVAVASGQIFSEAALPLCLPFGIGIELAHCASIILDDLPSMDDGQFRRGKPCAHLVFPRWAVELAPLFMVLAAYRLGLGNELVPHDRRVATASDIAAAGHDMIHGQAIDVTHSLSSCSSDLMLECYRQKSGALYAAAAKAGAISAGGSDAEAVRLHRAGMCIGIAYQFLDDVADATGAFELMGKLPAQDEKKPTAVHFFGVDGAVHASKQYRDEALDILSNFGSHARRLCEIANGASAASF